jgi:hypothetical protein
MAGYKRAGESAAMRVTVIRADNHYWVYFHHEWLCVPDNVGRRNYGNRTGQGVAWFREFEDIVVINCFVPTVEY